MQVHGEDVDSAINKGPSSLREKLLYRQCYRGQSRCRARCLTSSWSLGCAAYLAMVAVAGAACRELTQQEVALESPRAAKLNVWFVE